MPKPKKDGGHYAKTNGILPAKATLINIVDNIRHSVVEMILPEQTAQFRDVDAKIILLRKHLTNLPIK